MIEASCHCGNVKITLPNTTDTVISCNCSSCRRFGALWTYFEPADVRVDCVQDALGSYCWGDKTIEFHHCKSCGCVTHYTPTAAGNPDRMAVNFRMVPLETMKAVNVRYFDGADTWTFIE